MENFDFRKYRNELANNIRNEQDRPKRKKIIEEAKKTEQYGLAKKIKSELKKDRVEAILRKLGIERDEEGKIILYHATTAENLAKILKDKALIPPKETGSRVWRRQGENQEHKLEKIYLATKKSTEIIAEGIQMDKRGSVYILEVHVDEDKLLPDEDSKEKSWINSISLGSSETSSFGRSCSFKGKIDKFRIYKKLKHRLPKERERYYYEIPWNKESEKMADEEIEKRKTEEENLFRQEDLERIKSDLS